LKKILIVEDERILAVSLKMDLNDAGYTNITLVASGEEAIMAVKEQPVDVILMDINILGEKTGIDTADLISGFSPVPVIYLTGETDAETKNKALATSNCKGYLTKPVNMSLLEPIMTQIFGYSLA